MLAALIIDAILNEPLSFILFFPQEKSSGIRLCGISRVGKGTSSPPLMLSGQTSSYVAL